MGSLPWIGTPIHYSKAQTSKQGQFNQALTEFVVFFTIYLLGNMHPLKV
ncbi:hypothetical protein AcdelDRAFT_2689 [Acidovorax delafieldii 2AN]|uniref:Uncharacterized protein n=1 Tax=Acidovorax delafieldii 2AN TaxID=573060 RepID=C5T709_ACIDE|nr:hypothetical protein AcdelDRAFT_2689 [Acidovorax delafieldii 2AN]